MTLRRFSIKDTGAIRKAECSDIPKLMIVAGPNGVGKSTLFEQINTELQSRRISGTIEVESPNMIQSVYLSPHRAPAPGDMSASLLSSLGRESSRERLGSANYNLNSSGVPSVIRYNNNKRSRKRADFAPFFELKKRLAQLEFDRGQLLADMYDEQGKIPEGSFPDLGEPLKEGINSVLPGIEYQGVKQTDDREYEILFNDRSGSSVEFDDLSSGEKDAIALIFNLVEKKIESKISSVRDDSPPQEDLVVLIDSPEAYLHPAMQERFLDFVLKEIETTQDEESGLQVLMCTHSQSIIQNVSEEYLYFLLYQDQRQDNQLVSAEGISLETINAITGEIGTTALSSGNPLVLVEGKTDREVLRKLYPEMVNKVEILPMGGKGEIMNFSNAFNKIVPELYRKGIFFFAIVDRDRDLNIDSPYAGFVHPLSATCMENHLLDNKALFESLNTIASGEKLQEEGIEAPEDIESLLEKVIESKQFKEKEIRTRLNEKLRFQIHVDQFEDITDETAIKQHIDEVSNTKKERVADQIEQVQATVSDAIENRSYDRLNGKYILSYISEIFGLRVNVLRRITADMIATEGVQPEPLTETMNEIVQTVERSTTSATLLDNIESESSK